MAWNPNIPIIDNLVAEDLLDINENFAYLYTRIGAGTSEIVDTENTFTVVQNFASITVNSLPFDIDNVAYLNVAQEWSKQQNFNEAEIESEGDTTLDWNLDNDQCAFITLTENITVQNPTNMNAGGTYILRVVQAAGVYSLAWDTAFEWGSASAPAAPAANGDVAIFSFYSDGTTMYGGEFNRTEA